MRRELDEIQVLPRGERPPCGKCGKYADVHGMNSSALKGYASTHDIWFCGGCGFVFVTQRQEGT